MTMIWVDYAILGIIGLSALISVVRGFVREALSLAAWIAAFWVAFHFFERGAELLVPYISVPSVRLASAFLTLMVLTLLVGGVVNYLAGQLVQKTGLSGTDRMIGVLFGVVRGAAIVTLLVLLAGFTSLPKDPWWKQSVLLVHFQDAAVWLRGHMPADVAAYFIYE